MSNTTAPKEYEPSIPVGGPANPGGSGGKSAGFREVAVGKGLSVAVLAVGFACVPPGCSAGTWLRA